MYSLIHTNKMSIFDLFVKLDTNISTRLSQLELKTGLKSLGMEIPDSELQLIWDAMYKPKNGENKENSKVKQGEAPPSFTKKIKETEISYIDMINAFVEAGCIKLESSTDRAHLLV